MCSSLSANATPAHACEKGQTETAQTDGVCVRVCVRSSARRKAAAAWGVTVTAGRSSGRKSHTLVVLPGGETNSCWRESRRPGRTGQETRASRKTCLEKGSSSGSGANWDWLTRPRPPLLLLPLLLRASEEIQSQKKQKRQCGRLQRQSQLGNRRYKAKFHAALKSRFIFPQNFALVASCCPDHIHDPHRRSLSFFEISVLFVGTFSAGSVSCGRVRVRVESAFAWGRRRRRSSQRWPEWGHFGSSHTRASLSYVSKGCRALEFELPPALPISGRNCRFTFLSD